MRVENGFYVPSERYREVAGYEGKYLVSDRGRVFSLKTGSRVELRLLQGGRYVNLSRGGKVEKASVAYLVARAFIPNLELRPKVRHINGDVRDNRASNIEWCEYVDRRTTVGARSLGRRVLCVSEDGTVSEYPSIALASDATGVSRTGILKCVNGEQKTAGGMKWRAVEC